MGDAVASPGYDADTIFAHAKIGLETLLFVIYAFLRFNTSVRQL
jgi:hypothetical protein